MSGRFEKLKGLRMLIVEDDIFIVMEIENMLREIGCEIVGLAPTVKAALEAIRSKELDGVLLDMNLRGERSTPVAEELLSRGVPFILCTGYPKQPGDDEAIKDAPRLSKPYDLPRLRSAISEVYISKL